MAYNPFEALLPPEEKKRQRVPFTLQPPDLRTLPTAVPGVSIAELLSRAEPPTVEDRPRLEPFKPRTQDVDPVQTPVLDIPLQPITPPDAQPSSAITLRPYEALPEQAETVFGDRDAIVPPVSNVSSAISPRPMVSSNPTLTPRLSLGADDMIAPPPPLAPTTSAAPLANQAQRAAIMGKGGNPVDALLSRSPEEVAEQRLDWLQNPNNKVVDKPGGKRGRLKDALLAALMGAGQAVKANGGVADWSALGGAIGGGIGGAIRPDWNEQMERQSDIAQTQEYLEGLQNRQAFKLKARHQQAVTDNIVEDNKRLREQGDRKSTLEREKFEEAKKRNADLEYDRAFKRTIGKVKLGYRKGVNASLDAELARNGIEIEQWDDNKRTVWVGQNLMTFGPDGEAEPVLDAQGKPVTDVTRAPVKINYDGQEFTVSQTEAFRGLTAAGRVNTTIENQNIADENERKEKLSKADADLAGVQAEMDALSRSNNALRIEATALDPIMQEERIKSVQQQIKENESKFFGLQGKQKELQKAKQNLSRAITDRKSTAVPKVSSAVSEGVFRERLIANGVTDSTQQKAIIAKAKADGVIR